jgi:hypothetical protein
MGWSWETEIFWVKTGEKPANGYTVASLKNLSVGQGKKES